MIYWLIGQPGCGKTTLAKRLKEQLDLYCGVPAVHLDGDDLRVIFGHKYAPEYFTKDYRIEQTRALQRFVAYIADQGITVIVSTVNPYRDVREEFKQLRPDVMEIFIHTKDIRGREDKWVKDFEEPITNYLSIPTGNGKTIEETFNTLYRYL